MLSVQNEAPGWIEPVCCYLITGPIFYRFLKPEWIPGLQHDDRLKWLVIQMLLFPAVFRFIYLIMPGERDYRLQNRYPGFRRKRIDQLLYSQLFDDSAGRYYVSNTWFDIVAFSSNEEDIMDSSIREHKWLRELTSPPGAGRSNRIHPEDFTHAQKEFNRNPGDFVRSLEKFSEDLRIQDFAKSIMMYCSDPSQTNQEQRKRLKCWVTLQHQIGKVIEGPEAGVTLSTSTVPVFPDPDSARDIFDELKKEDALKPTTEQSLRFFNRCVTIYSLRESAIEQSWKLERQRALVQILREFDKQLKPTLHQILEWFKKCTESPSPLTATCHQFQLNVCSFVEMMTGEKQASYRDAFKMLRNTGAERHQQWEILYTAIKELTAELDENRKIITCLQYRHVLENLPKRSSVAYPNLRQRITTGSSTGDWQRTWQLAVEAELDLMIQEYNVSTGAVQPPAPDAPAAPAVVPGPTPGAAAAPVVPAAPPRRPLKMLLQSDFDHRVSNWSRGASQRQHGPTPPILAISNLGQWMQWPSVERGKILYSSLSSNIHSFGKSYDVHEINWLSQDNLILEWLKPVAIDDEGNVDWDDEWTNQKGLPT